MRDADGALHALFEANRLLREAGEKLAAAAGQTHARRMVLQAAEADGATVPEIARKLGLHRQGIQRIADDLVAEGLGRYVDNPRHRLSKVFTLTDQGHTALSEIDRAHLRWVDGIEAEATELDWTALHGALQELVRVLRDRSDRGATSV